jgi:hypothetical protein
MYAGEINSEFFKIEIPWQVHCNIGLNMAVIVQVSDTTMLNIYSTARPMI